jgi:hypothetical protein
MSVSRHALRTQVLTRLGDLAQQIWTATEVELHLADAYKAIAQVCGVFYDWTYLENLPATFSYTAPWEKAWLDEVGGFDAGCANFTAEIDRQALGDGRDRRGPANATSPFEVTDGWQASVGASMAIPATADLPTTLTAIRRVTWDNRGIDALEARRMSRSDARYEITTGEVYGYIWQKDGIRTLRKVRVPAAPADSVQVTGSGSWGILREPVDLSTDRATPRAWSTPGFDAGGFAADAFYTDRFDGVVWGVPRRIPGEHPLGPDYQGLPRRPFREGKNVRVEIARQGRAVTRDTDVWELPDRYTCYLRDYAMARCLARNGPGQDVTLAAHFQDRWQRAVARVTRRMQTVDTEHVSVMGGDARPLTRRPPRPSPPWPYGAEVR